MENQSLWGQARVGLLLGAGASQPLGLPMMLNLLPDNYRGVLGNSDEQRVFDMAVNWARAQGGKGVDFEYVFTAVDALAAMRHDDLVSLAFAAHEGNRGFEFRSGPDRFVLDVDNVRATAQALLTKLKVTVHDRLGDVDPSKAAAVFIPLLDMLMEATGPHSVLDCYSTNYDRTIESTWNDTHEERQGILWRLNRGFVQLNPNRGLELDVSSFRDEGASGPKVPTINLIKLHGGLNWIKEEERVFESPTTDYVRRNSLIYPLRKSRLDQPFQALFERFERTLASLDVLVIVGSSLRDPHIRTALVKAVRGRPTLRLVLLAPDSSEIVATFDDDVEAAFLPAVGYFGQDAGMREMRDRLQEALGRDRGTAGR